MKHYKKTIKRNNNGFYSIELIKREMYALPHDDRGLVLLSPAGDGYVIVVQEVVLRGHI